MRLRNHVAVCGFLYQIIFFCNSNYKFNYKLLRFQLALATEFTCQILLSCLLIIRLSTKLPAHMLIEN